jgi:hypothetical protein
MRTEQGSVADQETRVAQLVASVGAALNADLAGLTQQIHLRLSTEIEELKGDERILQLLASSIEGNVDTILHMFQHGIGIDRVEPPSAAVEYSRRLAQRGVPVNALVRAVRGGQPSDRDREDAGLLVTTKAEHKRSTGRYGAPRIHAELRHGAADAP